VGEEEEILSMALATIFFLLVATKTARNTLLLHRVFVFYAG
jgi:hypothetical protein